MTLTGEPTASTGAQDFYPATFVGQVLGMLFVISSLGLLGFVIGDMSAILSERREHNRLGHRGINFENHVIILGWDAFAKDIVHELMLSNIKTAIITNDKEHLDMIDINYSEYKDKVFVLVWDMDDFGHLQKCNFSKAKVLLLNFGDDTTKLVSALKVKNTDFAGKIITALDTAGLEETFYNAGVESIVKKEEISAKLVASHIYEPDVAQYIEDLIATAVSEEDYDIQQFLVTNENPFCNKLYGETLLQLKQEYNALLIGLSKSTLDGRVLYKLANRDMRIEKGDYIILIINGKNALILSQIFGVSEGDMQ